MYGCEGSCGSCFAESVCSSDGQCMSADELCGDGVCDAETCATCPEDCGCSSENVCLDSSCSPSCEGEGCGGSEPQILSFTASATVLSEGGTVTFSVIVSDPDGAEDLAGALLLAGGGGSYGTMSGEPGSGYSLDVTWAQINAVRSIDFTSGQSRVFVAEVFDAAGNRSRAQVEVALGCGGSGSCAGVCTTLGTEENCGGCGHVCELGVCQSGACACPGSQRECGGACIDTQSDPTNCGGCDVTCEGVDGGAPICRDGSCGVSCEGALGECGGGCVDNTSDAEHCGVCDNACEAPAGALASCQASTCEWECDASRTECNGACPACPVDGVAASACDGQACVATSCLEGYRLEGGQCLTRGVEHIADLTSPSRTTLHMDLEVDSSRKPWLAFSDTSSGGGATVHFAERNTGVWTVSEFSTPRGAVYTAPDVRIAIDGGNPVVAYTKWRRASFPTSHGLSGFWVSQRGNSGWSHTAVREVEDWGTLGGPSVVVTSAGVLASFGEVRWGGSRLDELEWIRTYTWSADLESYVLPALEGFMSRIVADSGAFHAVTWSSSEGVGYASYTTSWDQTPIADDYRLADRIAVASDGPIIIYSTDSGLYAAREATEWAIETVDETFGTTDRMRYDLAIDGSGVPHVCYAGDSGLYTSQLTADGWLRQEQRAETGIWGCALDFSDADLHLVYVQADDEGNGRVRYYQ